MVQAIFIIDRSFAKNWCIKPPNNHDWSPYRRKKRPYYAVLAHFLFPVVTLVTFSSNLSHFVRNPYKPLKNKNKISEKKKKKKIQQQKNSKKIQK